MYKRSCKNPKDPFYTSNLFIIKQVINLILKMYKKQMIFIQPLCVMIAPDINF